MCIELAKIQYVKKKKLNLTVQHNNIKTINYDHVRKGKVNDHNRNWPETADHPYRILTIGGSRSGKTNTLLNLIKKQDGDNHSIIDNFFLIY